MKVSRERLMHLLKVRHELEETDINTEYELIQKKVSNLSARQRAVVCELYKLSLKVEDIKEERKEENENTSE